MKLAFFVPSMPTKQISMKIIALFLLSMLATETVYAEQRLSAIKPGISCSKIPEIEMRLGSTESSVKGTADISQYEGTQGGKIATIIYHCDKGLLDEQQIIVASTTRDGAYEFANEQKIELIQRLGNPIHDGLVLSAWRKMFFGFLGADLDYLTTVIVWGRKKEDVILMIKEIGVNQWEVSISQGSSKLEYILNS